MKKHLADVFVNLYKTYKRLCPAERPEHAFYLQPLRVTVSIHGHSTLAAVSRIFKTAGISGYK